MKARLATIVVLLAATLSVTGLMRAWGQSAAPAAMPIAAAAPDPNLVARGARLVALGDCASCHNAVGGQPFAGGRPLPTPFGTIFTTNITPDPDTGIGQWTLQDFTRAMRDGKARNGQFLYPAFPYPHYTHMSDDDIGAIYAFLMTRAPVHAVAPANQLTFPLNFRPVMFGWNLLFLRRGPIADDTTQSVEWNRGRYLVDGPGHCAACHTPMNILGAEKSGSPFAGGFAEGWQSPALNALSQAPIPWTKPQLVSYLSTGLASEHGAAAGPMLSVTQGLARVPPADVEAIATYVLSLQQPGPAVTTGAVVAQNTAAAAAPAPDSAAADRIQMGSTLFNASCASCHDKAAPMTTFGGRPPLSLSTSVNAADPRNTINLILGGIPLAGSDQAHYMPPFATLLTDAQIADIAMYVRAHFTPQQPAWTQLDDTVTKIRKEANPS